MAHGVDAERQLGMVRREGQSLRSASPTNGRRPDRAEENKRRLEDPNSVLLLPQTKAGMACVSMLYMFDKVIHRLRRAAGSQLSIEQVRNELARVEQWVARAKVILRELGVGEFELLPQDPYPDLKERSVKAAWRNTEMHRVAQATGRARVFRDYRLRVARVVRDYGMLQRAEAPTDSPWGA